MNNPTKRPGRTATHLAIMAAVAGLLSAGPSLAADTFEYAGVRLEQNILDKDIEVKFDALSRKGGIAALKVTAPDGRVVIDFKSPGSKFGMRHVELETPEPANDGKLLADFPEGIYQFAGTSTSGDELYAMATLSHKLPPAPKVISPRPEQEDVPIIGTKVRWEPMKDITQFVVILEHEKTGREITTIQPGTLNVFSVPVGFLMLGADYKVEIGAVAKNGNRTFVEYEFSTVKRP